MKKLFTLLVMSICMVLTANAQDNHTYGVCGWGGDWNNDIAMTESPEGTWTAEITGVAAGTYSFKVRADGKWDIAYPGQDYVYNVNANNSTVTIVFYESTGNIEVSQTSDEAPVEIKHTYGVCGWDGDWNNDIAMTESPEGTWTAKITDVAAGKYSFKVRADGSWTINYPSNDYILTVDEDNSTVIIVFVESTKEITITQTVSTAIDRVNAEAENAPAYNLAGVKAKKGLVIKNNKKYILR